MPLYLVRHAKAGSRSAWTDDDRVRPLVPEGWMQAEFIAKRFADLSVGPLLSSPALRCVQTLEPLAVARGIDIRQDERLFEGSAFEPALALLEDVADHAVLCSHGDLIPEILEALVRRGMSAEGLQRGLKKGAVVVVHRDNGRFVHTESWPAP